MFVSALPRRLPFLAAILLGACGAPSDNPEPDSGGNAAASATGPNPAKASAPGQPMTEPGPVPTDPSLPANPAPPGAAKGLDDDGTPVSEAPFSDRSGQAAANVVQTYFALIEARKFADAWKLWSDEGRSSGMDSRSFVEAFGKYRDYHAEIGTPGELNGAAGSIYVEVPIHAYGRRSNGAPFRERGKVALRRVNEVPGSTSEQRQWHIESVTIGPGASGD